MTDQKYTTLAYAFEQLGTSKIAAACDITTTPCSKWKVKGLPMSDLTGETDYALRIDFLAAKNNVELSWVELIRERLADLKPGIEYRIPVDLVQPDPNQPRKQFDEDKLNALAATLKTDGQETPIKVSVDMSQAAPLILTHGERRWRAAQIAGIGTLRCMVDDKANDEDEAARIFRQAADNTGEQLSKWDMACMIRDLSERLKMKDQEISDQLTRRGFDGYSRPVVANLRRLFKLPDSAQQLIAIGWLTPSHGKYLLACQHEKSQQAVILRLVEEHQSGKEAPTTSSLEWWISGALRNNAFGLDVWTEKGGFASFDHEETCIDCDQIMKYSDRHYCPNQTCYEAKQREAMAKEEAEEETGETGAPGLQGQGQTDRTEERWEDSWEYRRKKREIFYGLAREKIRQADKGLLLALLLGDIYYEYLLDDTEEMPTLSETVEIFTKDPDGSLRRLADEALWLSWGDNDVAAVLGIDLDAIDVPRETGAEQDAA